MRDWQTRLSAMLLLALICMAGTAAYLRAQPPPPPNPLEPFERIIGGEWHLDQTYQVFEWGVGEKSVVGRSYSLLNGESTLVGEGFWFYHPGEDEIRGYFVATGMGIDLFDYRTRFEGNAMISSLQTYGQFSGEFEEVWTFIAEDSFEWALHQESEEGREKLMGGTYTRR